MNLSGGFFDIDSKLELIKSEEEKTFEPDFWSSPQQAEQILKNISKLKIWTNAYEDAKNSFEDLLLIEEFCKTADATQTEFDTQYEICLKKIENLEFRKMLSNEEDILSAIIEINSGAGGTESQDWAQMLMRMYIRWAERNNYESKILDIQEGDVAGIKSVSIEIEGEYALGYLKSENGVHRLVRLSPFDTANKRHTSFASVYVYPIVDEHINIEINQIFKE